MQNNFVQKFWTVFKGKYIVEAVFSNNQFIHEIPKSS